MQNMCGKHPLYIVVVDQQECSPSTYLMVCHMQVKKNSNQKMKQSNQISEHFHWVVSYNAVHIACNYVHSKIFFDSLHIRCGS